MFGKSLKPKCLTSIFVLKCLADVLQILEFYMFGKSSAQIHLKTFGIHLAFA